ncbi:hypothetical protein GMLC_10600 [Geomonas limicola]|uniref:Uncharacterized protein n=1 Tax=Geomonas limicola TaxID=2740186 RepID=A0A6V8N4W4_9BACT|nr:sigma-70 family RNA polymerase sigma factor [Geomonas limicola]GFO67481.1 hypothetical protein GMLC_10600 [Geomonas limicola]
MNSGFETWVSSAACREPLRQCAKQVIRRANDLALQLDDSSDNSDDYLESVTALLWQFVKEHADSVAEKAAALLAGGDESSFMAYLTRAFLSDCVDKRRTDSPFHAYYRHMRAVISREERFRYLPCGFEGSYYACSTEESLDRLPERWCQGDFSGWSRSSVPYRDIHGNSGMLALARHFWDESLRQILAEYLLPIRELVRFVTFSYPMLVTAVVDHGADTERSEGATYGVADHLLPPELVAEAWSRQSRALEFDVVDTQLESLARECVAALTGRQKLVLDLYDQELTLEEIARRLDEKGPSNIHYHLKAARSVLKQRWGLWGPPVLREFAEVDEEEFFLFYETVISFCKRESEGRSK